MKIWIKIQEFCSLKSKFIMTIFTLNILGMCWYCIITNTPVNSQLAIIYIAVVGFYNNHRVKLKGKDMEVETSA